MLAPTTKVFSGTTGTVWAYDTGDANPNIVVKYETADKDWYIVYGHVAQPEDPQKRLRIGASVAPGTEIGQIANNNPPHLHLTLYSEQEGRKTVYNPLYFFPPTTFDYDAHISVQDTYGELATNQVIFQFDYSSSNWWLGEDNSALDLEGNVVKP